MPSSKNGSMDSKNVGRGPTVGNKGNPTKRGEFKADKVTKEGTAREILGALAARADSPTTPTTNHEARQGQISPVTNKGRGPRKGNK